MAITGKLLLGSTDSGEKWRVVHMDYSFFQPIDAYGYPSGSPDGGIINFVVESSSNDIQLIHWMLSRKNISDGVAMFYDRNGRVIRKVAFKGAFCVYYKEIFDAFDDNFMRIEFRVSCREIMIDDGGFETSLVKSWPGSESSSSSSAPTSSSSQQSSHIPSSPSEGIGSFNPND